MLPSPSSAVSQVLPAGQAEQLALAITDAAERLLLPAIERARLWVTDVEILRLHYAETLRHWRRRFVANWPRLAALYDERFCRMWEYYLAASECAFRYVGMNNFQIQFVKNQQALPLTRNYMIEQEDRLREIDSKLPRFKSVPAE